MRSIQTHRNQLTCQVANSSGSRSAEGDWVMCVLGVRAVGLFYLIELRRGEEGVRFFILLSLFHFRIALSVTVDAFISHNDAAPN